MRQQNMGRRRFLKRASAVGAAAAVAGCTSITGSGGGKPNNIRLGTWAGTWQDLMIQAVVDPFKQETDIGAQYVLGDNTQRLNKIIAQKSSPPVDISQQDGSGLVRGSNADIWQSLDEELVPALSKIPDNFKSDDWVMQIFAASGLLYNPDEVGSAPGSWEAYLNPDYKGKVGLYTEDPTHDLLAFSLSRTDGESFKDTEQAFEMYEEVLKTMDPEFITSSEEYGKLFAQGDIVLGRYWSARAAQWESEGKPVTSAVPQQGAMTTNFGNAIPKNIPEQNVEWAGKFIDYTLRQQAAKVIAENMFYTNPDPEMEYPDSVSDKLVNSEDLENLNVPDFDWIAENRASWRERANELVNQYS
ncbi:hypothetical protein AUR64_11175 [Haloprofundus marisrubri]|uniref:ABC transporter substrate-binding protein n=1 Tax=Haloprofundus marisrubri TaxID=1514971 RepID=A0A0W1R929_9EURY|nr:extracellular solute-binding protein [Haloprofundus marisrubri]KTG10148.1 hypothetical protein AUR64_11175 [Haloprofundus marisrubri]